MQGSAQAAKRDAHRYRGHAQTLGDVLGLDVLFVAQGQQLAAAAGDAAQAFRARAAAVVGRGQHLLPDLGQRLDGGGAEAGTGTGMVTPTEAAAVAAAYALLLACGVYRALSFSGVVNLFIGAARSTAIVALVVAGALLINYVVAAEQIPNEIGAWIQTLHVSRFGFHW